MQDVSGNLSQSCQLAYDNAGKLIGTLNKVQLKPKLRSDLWGLLP
jgi:hypothetical protein